ncbi:MAG: hypothetical protein FD174_1413 [Geobacteraceae bacterium]|nr:MAG: hypothetical protein FD174_1413 [Geobacteraceae bacterium]
MEITITIVAGSHSEVRRKLCKNIKGKVFHVTTDVGWEGIQAKGAILPSNSCNEIEKVWTGPAVGYFRSRGCVSLCDFYHNTNMKKIIEATRKYCFYHPSRKSKSSYLLILDHSLYDSLITWDKWKEEKAYRESIVPNLESGFKGSISLAMITGVIEVQLHDY